ncbi:MAG TPA: DUF952 domain-containing protein [Acidimicrobiales bacterium]|nr:DUF952 domain-containing protein [Acidimicrobiales bacterium]
MILHLMQRDEWDGWRADGPYSPASLATEGFVHCTGDDQLMLAVANRFYAAAGEMVVVTLDETRLASELRWEAPAHPDGSPPATTEPRFPHVYGPLDGAAVIDVRRLRRQGETFVGYEPIA